jgi:hypothetical protein
MEQDRVVDIQRKNGQLLDRISHQMNLKFKVVPPKPPIKSGTIEKIRHDKLIATENSV